MYLTICILVLQDSFADLNVKGVRHRIPFNAISISLDRHDPQRELTSQLISDLYGRVLTQDDITQGFDDVLNSLSDLTLDTPEAPTVSILFRNT